MSRREWVLLDDPGKNRFTVPSTLLNDTIHVIVIGAGGGGGGGGGNNSTTVLAEEEAAQPAALLCSL